MEFWGVEIKPGKPLKVEPEVGRLIHISQFALGEVKDVEGAKRVNLKLKFDGKNLIIGSLSSEERPQLMTDLVFEKEFELSHDWKDGSVFIIGYTAEDPVSDISDEEEERFGTFENGEAAKIDAAKTAAAKTATAAVAKMGSKKVDSSDSDEDDDFSDGSSSDDLRDSDDSETGSDMSSSDEELPVPQPQPPPSKKRPAESTEKRPAPAKKAKRQTPKSRP